MSHPTSANPHPDKAWVLDEPEHCADPKCACRDNWFVPWHARQRPDFAAWVEAKYAHVIANFKQPVYEPMQLELRCEN